MKKRVTLLILVVAVVMALTGCTEAQKVSGDLRQDVGNFNVMRRLTVINMRTDKIILCMTGKMSIQNEGNNELAVLVEIDHKKGIYQKHLVYLNEWTMYTVEDISGVSVSRYDYEIEFMPEMIVPVKFKADEVVEEIEDIIEKE